MSHREEVAAFREILKHTYSDVKQIKENLETNLEKNIELEILGLSSKHFRNYYFQLGIQYSENFN